MTKGRARPMGTKSGFDERKAGTPEHKSRTRLSERLRCAVVVLGVAGAAAATLTAGAAGAMAQGPVGGATGSFDIAGGPLGTVLSRFAAAAGVTLSFDTAMTAGKSSPGLQGRMTAAEGFSRLLAGSGLTWRFVDPQTVLLEKPTGDGAVLLNPVTVEGAGRAENAFGPVHGFVATRSATGTKTDTPLVETPQSISVVGAEEMRTRNVQNLEDAVKYTPGLHLSYGATGDSRMGWFSIRGFPTYDYYTDGLNNSVAMGIGWQRTDPYLTDRVEVLRGPASVMYGQAIPGGMINMVSKRPQEAQAAEAAVEYGSFGWKRAEGDLTGPLDEDGRWLYRIVAVAQDSDGLNGVDHDRNDRVLFAPALTWRPQAGTSVTVLASRTEDKSRGWTPPIRYRTAVGESDRSTYLGEPDHDSYRMKQTNLTAIAEHQVSDALKFTATARYSDLDLKTDTIWLGLIEADGRTMGRYNWAYKGKGDSYAMDAHAEAKASLLSMEHTVIAGMDYAYFKADTGNTWADSSGIDIFDPVYGTYTLGDMVESVVKFRRLGFYAQDQVRIADDWFFLMGGRYDAKGSAGQDAFSGRLGLAYRTGFGLVPYASYTESFEQQSGSGWGGERFQPTSGRQYEVGVKYEPPGLNAIATLALFDLRKQNVLTPDPNPLHLCNGGPCSVQTGEVASRGVELGLTMELADGLNAVASYTYNPVEVTKSNTPGQVGKQIDNQPVHLASLWLDYGVKSGPFTGFGLGGGLRFVGKTVNVNRDVTTSPYVMDEAMIRYERDAWRLSLNVRNLFDRDIGYVCNQDSNSNYCYLQEPLTVTARLARTF